MMGLSVPCFFSFLRFLFCLCFLHHFAVSLHFASSMMQPLCHDDERSALLQFKQSILFGFGFGNLNRLVDFNFATFPLLLSSLKSRKPCRRTREREERTGREERTKRMMRSVSLSSRKTDRNTPKWFACLGMAGAKLHALMGPSDEKADVILKYMPDEARLLKAYGELPENTRLNEGIAGGLDEEDEGAGDDYIEFEDEDIDKI
ncbi:hypothetical protein QYF36_006216 [Acer negundo]|nr:hypothetical protein QYF36_006216 [Acer negundo]